MATTKASDPLLALTLLDTAIADLEGRLGLEPGASATAASSTSSKKDNKAKKQASNAKQASGNANKNSKTSNNEDQPDICKLEFKVGVITKVWEHPEADKLYCEEIDVGEGTSSGPRPRPGWTGSP